MAIIVKRWGRWRSLVQIGGFSGWLLGGVAAGQNTPGNDLWTGPSGSSTLNWSSGTGWLGGAPTPGIGTVLTFNQPYGGNGGVSLVTSNNDIANFTLNSLVLANDGGLTLSGNPLYFSTNGSSVLPTLQVAAAGATALSANLDVTGTTLNITGSGSGILTISGQITSTSGGAINFNRTGGSLGSIIALTNTSTTAPNNYGGTTTLTAGHVSVGTSSANPFGTGGLTIATTGQDFAATGDLRSSIASQVIPNAVTINSGATFNLLLGSGSVFTGTIGGTGGVYLGSLASIATTVVNTFENTANYSGTTTVQSGGNLTLASNGSTSQGNFSQGPGISVDRAALLTIGSAASTLSTNRIADTIPIAIGGGSVILVSPTAVADAETLGTVTFGGGSILTGTPSTTGTADLTVTNLVRAGNGLILLRGTALGTNAAGTASDASITLGSINSASPTAALLGGGGAAGTQTISILPYAVAGITTSSNGTSFVTVSAAGLSRPLLAASEYSTTLPLTGGTTQLNVLGATAGGLPGVRSATAINALNVGTSTANASVSGAGVYGPSTLTISSGAVLASGTAGSTYFNVGTLAFGASEGIITSVTDSAVNSAIAGTKGLTIGGAGSVSLYGSLSGLTNSGNTNVITVAGGSLALSEGSQLSGLTGGIALDGGTIIGNGGSLAGRGGLTLAAGVFIGANGGSIRSDPATATTSGGNGGSTQTFTLSGNLTGSGPLVINGTANGVQTGNGTVLLSGTNSGFSGSVNLAGGITQISSDAQLGTGTSLIIGDATLEATSSFTSSKTIVFNSSSSGGPKILTDPGVTLTLSGTLNQAVTGGASFTKLGTGELDITGANSFNNGLSIGLAQTLAFPDGQPGGTVRLVNGGTLTGSVSLTVYAGGTLILDNTGSANLGDRLSNSISPLSLGGKLTLTGASTNGTSSQFSSESIYNLNLLAQNGSVVRIEPGTAGALFNVAYYSTSGTTVGLTRNLGSTLVVQSPGTLGTGGTNAELRFTNNVAANFNSSTTSLNGLVSGLFTDDATGYNLGVVVPTDSTRLINYVKPLTGTETLVTSNSSGTQSPATYQTTFAGTSSSSTSTVVVSSGAEILTAATAVNSFALQSGGTLANSSTLTLALGNILLAPGSGGITGGGVITASAGLDISLFVPGNSSNVITVANTLSAPLTGTTLHVISKTGGGTLVLAGTYPSSGLNSAIGEIYAIQQGTLQIGSTAALATPSNTFRVQNGATLDLNGYSVTAGYLDGTGTILLNGGTLTINGQYNATGTLTATNSSFGGAITGTGSSSVVKTGTSTFTVGYYGSIAAPISLQGGVLQFGGSTAVDYPVASVSGGDITAFDGTEISILNVANFARNININSGSTTGTVTIDNASSLSPTATTLSGNIAVAANKTAALLGSPGGDFLYSGTISGVGAVQITGNTVLFSGNNSYGGGTTITASSAVVGIGNASAFGSGTVTISAAARLFPYLGSFSVANNLIISATSVNFAAPTSYRGDYALAFTGSTTLTGTALTVTTTSGPVTLNNLTSSATPLTKAGGASLTLTGTAALNANAVTISAGTLLVNGTLTSTASPGVTVGVTGSARAILGGTGTLNASATLTNVGVVAPGTETSTGQFTVNGALTATGGSYLARINGSGGNASAGTNYDQIIVGSAGSVTLGGTAILALAGTYVPVAGDTFFLIDNHQSSSAISGTFASLAEGSTVSFNGSTLTATYLANAAGNATTGGRDFALFDPSPVPEPASLLGLAAIGFAAYRRRRISLSGTES